MSKKLTQEEAIEKIKNIWGEEYDLTFAEYVDARTPMKLICKQHGEFPKSLNKLTSSKKEGCPDCGLKRRAESKTNSQEKVISQIREIHGDLYDLSKVEYKAMKKPIVIGCKKHGWKTILPNTMIYGKSGCPDCGRERSEVAKYRSFEDVLNQAKTVHNNKYDYNKITNYTETTETYTIVCPIHGDFEQVFANHISGSGCDKCGYINTGLKKRLSQEDVIKRFKEVHGEDTYCYNKVEYELQDKDVIITCKKHGDFEQLPINHMRGCGCSKCSNGVSKGESELAEFISEYVEMNKSDRKIMGDRKEVDMYIPSLNLAIEYNGLYFHSDKFQDNNYHLDKTKKCLDKGIQLIHVFEDEWTYKKDIVKSRILNIIGHTVNKIYARNTEVKEVDSRVLSKFLKENHIQGNVASKVKLGLFKDGELVSVMTFGDLRKSLGSKKEEGHFELLRFCNKLNTTVIGGASKLLKYFENNYSPKSLISYADRRWSQGGLYESLNFTLIGTSRPNYFYIKGNVREGRFKYRKDVLVSEGYSKDKTEKEIMEERGYLRIYDCGTLKYKKEYKATPKG